METVLADRLQVIQGDITALDIDIIVNAANTSLLGGGGVDGAIHRAAGPGLLAECRSLCGCPTGQVRLTRGHSLRAKYVIHAVGPVYRTGQEGEADLLRSCYQESLRLATERKADTIAFPCISTGIYRYPKSAACRIAIDAVTTWLLDREHPRCVIFCCFETIDAALYRDCLRNLQKPD